MGEPSPDIGPPGTSQLHIISNDESSPRDLHLNAKTQLHSTTSKLQCWTPYAKQLQDRNTNPPLAERLPKIIIRSQTPQNTPPDAVLPNRKTRASLIHENTDTSTLHQEDYTLTEPTSATGGRHQKQWEIRTCSQGKGDPRHSKLSKMRRQRNAQQMKEQGKNPPDETNEEEIGSLPEKEFRVMIVKMIQNLVNGMEKIEETFNKDLEEQKGKQTMMNNTIIEIKSSLEEINSRITEAKEQTSDLEDKIVEILP